MVIYFLLNLISMILRKNIADSFLTGKKLQCKHFLSNKPFSVLNKTIHDMKIKL